MIPSSPQFYTVGPVQSHSSAAKSSCPDYNFLEVSANLLIKSLVYGLWESSCWSPFSFIAKGYWPVKEDKQKKLNVRHKKMFVILTFCILPALHTFTGDTKSAVVTEKKEASTTIIISLY